MGGAWGFDAGASPTVGQQAVPWVLSGALEQAWGFDGPPRHRPAVKRLRWLALPLHWPTARGSKVREEAPAISTGLGDSMVGGSDRRSASGRRNTEVVPAREVSWRPRGRDRSRERGETRPARPMAGWFRGERGGAPAKADFLRPEAQRATQAPDPLRQGRPPAEPRPPRPRFAGPPVAKAQAAPKIFAPGPTRVGGACMDLVWTVR